MKKFGSMFLAILLCAVTLSPCVGVYADDMIAVSDDISESLARSAMNTYGQLSFQDEVYSIYPSSVEVQNISEGKYSTTTVYEIELLSGSGQMENHDSDFVSGATVTVTIHYSTMTERLYLFIRLDSFEIDIEWTDDQIVLGGLSYYCASTGQTPWSTLEPSTTYQYDSGSFPISGHHYEKSTGFEYYSAPMMGNFACGCTATATFERGAASSWEFSVACNYN